MALETAHRPWVLIVDPEARARSGLRQALDDHYQLLDAPDGRTALRLVRTRPLALVALELRLPDMSGLDLLGDLHARAPDLPLVVVTVDRSLRSGLEATRRGAMEYLTKPVEAELLLTTVRRLVDPPLSTILVVSADDGRRAVLAALLRRYGTVVPAAHTAGALAAVSDARPVLVVLDAVDGVECFPAVRRRAIRAGIPAVCADSAGGLAGLFDRARARLSGHAPDVPRVSARIAETLEVVAARCTTPLTVAALATEARLSEGRFAHVFRAEIGLSPRQLVRRARVELAREMIVHERRRHHEVARALGFVDGSHLAKVFRAETGRRLSECREG